ncbi:MAG: hypothetical protein ABEI53_01260 [Candidatus Magasanikbacteria bacterium]
MKRALKQFLYGSFYLLLFSFLVWGFYSIFLKPSPSCSDGLKNQGEKRVDCGGPCVECSRLNVKPVFKKGDADLFKINTSTYSFISVIKNPNENYAGVVDYSLEVISKFGKLLRKVNGSLYVLPSSNYHLHRVFTGLEEGLGKVKVSLGDTKWFENSDYKRPKITTSSTSFSSKSALLKGKIKNSTSRSWNKIELIAIFRNKYGQGVGSSQTVVNNLKAFEKVDFKISMPVDKELRKTIDLDNTKVLTNPIN